VKDPIITYARNGYVVSVRTFDKSVDKIYNLLNLKYERRVNLELKREIEEPL